MPEADAKLYRKEVPSGLVQTEHDSIEVSAGVLGEEGEQAFYPQ